MFVGLTKYADKQGDYSAMYALLIIPVGVFLYIMYRILKKEYHKSQVNAARGKATWYIQWTIVSMDTFVLQNFVRKLDIP